METNELVCPKTWLAESILVTILCCLPFGIVGIIYAVKVETLFLSGNYEAAKQSSDTAGKWTKLGFFIGLAVIIIYLFVTLCSLWCSNI